MFPITSGPSSHPELSPLSLVRMLWKSKLLTGLVWIFLCLLSGAIVYSIPSMYRAEAVILVDSQKVPERYVASTVNADVQDRLAVISQHILSSNRLQRIIDNYRLYRREKGRLSPEEIVEMMRKDTKVTLERSLSQERANAFRISYQGPDPVTVAEVANQIGNLFIEENLRTRENHAEGTSEFIEEQLQQAKKTLTALESQQEDYKLKHKGELPEQQNSLAGALSRLQIELQGNQEAINRAEQSKTLLSTSLSMAESTAKVLERSPGVQRNAQAPGAAAKTSVALQTELDLMRMRYTAGHPDVQRMEQLVAQSRLSEKKAAPDTAVVEALPSDLLQQRERIARLKTELSLAGRELEYRNAERLQILAKLTAMQSQMDVMPVREQELTALSRDYEIAKANYKSLLDKRIAADMATDLERRQQGERFTMIDPAQPPIKPFSPDRAQWLGLCFTLALLVAVVAGMAREMQRNVLLGEWELPADIAILGRISPIVPAAQSRAPVEVSS
jgi:succinoglycan biosynthesis transport protein ExoP